jgi:hypothetical protein
MTPQASKYYFSLIRVAAIIAAILIHGLIISKEPWLNFIAIIGWGLYWTTTYNKFRGEVNTKN